MSKELSKELVDRFKPKCSGNSQEILNTELAKQCALIAQEYAKKEAISFAEWKDSKDYVCTLHTNENEKIWQDSYGMGSYTTEQLYNLYIQSKNNDKRK